mmetsp:Transcript_7252/g.22107  ORF Transcript_7252/g.22107 Transcript_7252/m.22107 type:complete len:264 (+) Transcript_7252:1366-2157(+)
MHTGNLDAESSPLLLIELADGADEAENQPASFKGDKRELKDLAVREKRFFVDASNGQNPSIDNVRATADMLYLDKQHFKAHSWYVKLGQMREDSVGLGREAKEGQVRCLQAQRDFKGALTVVDELEKTFKAGSGDVIVLQLRGEILMELERFEEAADCFERKALQRPSVWTSWASLAEVYRRCSREDEARACLRRAHWLLQKQEPDSVHLLSHDESAEFGLSEPKSSVDEGNFSERFVKLWRETSRRDAAEENKGREADSRRL